MCVVVFLTSFFFAVLFILFLFLFFYFVFSVSPARIVCLPVCLLSKQYLIVYRIFSLKLLIFPSFSMLVAVHSHAKFSICFPAFKALVFVLVFFILSAHTYTHTHRFHLLFFCNILFSFINWKHPNTHEN